MNSTKTEQIIRIIDFWLKITSAYVGYLKEALLFFELPQFAYSLKKQQKALKKIYAVDSGMASAVSFRFK